MSHTTQRLAATAYALITDVVLAADDFEQLTPMGWLEKEDRNGTSTKTVLGVQATEDTALNFCRQLCGEGLLEAWGPGQYRKVPKQGAAGGWQS